MNDEIRENKRERAVKCLTLRLICCGCAQNG